MNKAAENEPIDEIRLTKKKKIINIPRGFEFKFANAQCALH